VGGTVEESVGVSLALSEDEQNAQLLLAAKAEAEERAARAAEQATQAARAVLIAAEGRAKTLAAASKVSDDNLKMAKAALKAGGE
jgi:hypothetical protein